MISNAAILEEVELNTDVPRWLAWRMAAQEYGYRRVNKAYLMSDQWRDFREEHLSRQPRCQCCWKADSFQVHHTSYQYMFFENSSDLQAVCRRCHETLSAMDNHRKMSKG